MASAEAFEVPQILSNGQREPEILSMVGRTDKTEEETKTMQATPQMIKLMSPADRAFCDPLKLTEPIVPDPGKQTGLEKDLQRLCELELSRRNIWYLHLSPRAREKAGVPDLIFCIDGVAWAVELKTATGSLSKEQKATLLEMKRNGWLIAIVRSYEQFKSVVFGEEIEKKEEV